MSDKDNAHLTWLGKHQHEAPPSVRQSVQENARRNAASLSGAERKRLSDLLRQMHKLA